MAVDIIARGLASQKASVYIFVENYDALPIDPVPNQLYYCLNSQGTSWLPGGLGGIYRPAGPYYYDGANWQYIDSPLAASQEEVNAGIEIYKFISPNTFQNSTQLYDLQQGVLNIDNINHELGLKVIWKTGSDLYQEFEWQDSRISRIYYWDTPGKEVLLFDKRIEYSASGLASRIFLMDQLTTLTVETRINYDVDDFTILSIEQTLY